MSKLVNDYTRDNSKTDYSAKITLKDGDTLVSKEFTFSNIEVEKIVNLYQEYLVPDTQVVTAVTERNLKSCKN